TLLLAARRRVGRPPRAPAPDNDFHRPRPRGAARHHPGALLARRPDAHAALRRELPCRDVERRLLRLLHDAVRLARAARALPRGELAPEREPGVLLRRRP